MDDSAYTTPASRAVAAGKGLAATNDNLAVTEEKVSRATRVREDSMDRLLGKLDPTIRAQQRYAQVQEQIERLQLEGVGTLAQHTQALALAEQKFLSTGTAAGGLESRFLSLSRVTRTLTLGFAIMQSIRFAENVVQNFDSIADKARSLGMAVDTDVVEKMRIARTAWEEEWVRMQVATANAVAPIIGDLAKLDAQIGKPMFFNAKNTLGVDPNAKSNVVPYVSNLDFAGTQAMRQKIWDENKKAADDIANFNQAQAEQQRAINNENAADTAARQEKVVADHKADNDAIAISDQDLAEQQRQIDNENFAAREAMRQRIMAEHKADADATVAFEQQKTAWVLRLDEQVQHRVVENIASIGDYMDQAGGKFGLAVENMIADISKLTVKLELTKLLEESIGSSSGGGGFSGILGLIGSALGIGGGDRFQGTIGGIDEIGAPPVTITAGAFASGGYIPPGQWGLTGESGEEYVYGGRTGATVVPNSDSGGGSVVNIIVNGARGNAEIRDMVAQGIVAAAPSLSANAVAAVRQAGRRGQF